MARRAGLANLDGGRRAPRVGVWWASVALVAAACGGGDRRGSGGGSGGSTTGGGPDVPADVGKAAVCGDGVLDPGEACDDGNTVDGDGCQADCTWPAYTGEAVFVGGRCTCVRLPGGRLRCWGGIDCSPHENLESGATETPAEAGDVSSPEPVVQIALAPKGGCARTVSGRVLCYGGDPIYGYGFPLGQGSKTWSPPGWLSEALEIPVPGSAVDVAFSGRHGCVVVNRGTLYCWGLNDEGPLGLGHTQWVGDDETPAEAGPVDVGGPVVDVEVGDAHTCVLLRDGAVRCFGAGDDGRLGTGAEDDIGDDEVPSSVPPVELGGPAVQLEVFRRNATCAIRQDGALFCWGLSAADGWGYDGSYIGDDETPLEAGPVPVGPVRDVAGYCYQGLEDERWRCW